MLKKNAKLEIMFEKGYRPEHGHWIDTYNKAYGFNVIFTITTGTSFRNGNYVVVEL